MSLIQFLRILMARKAIILATLIACFLTAAVTVQLLPERYEARNRVLIDMTKSGAFAERLTPAAVNAYVGTQLKLVKDVQTAGLVVDSLGWAADPGNQAAFEAAGRPGGDIREWLAQRIVANTEARFVDGSSIVEITYRGSDPASTQGIAQAIREAWLKLTQDRRTTSAQRAAATFEEQARNAEREVARAEEERTQYAKANGIVLQGGMDLESAKLGALSSATVAPRAAQVVAGVQGNPQIAAMRQQISQAQQTLGPNHPTLQAMRGQLAALESQSGGGGSTVIGGTTPAEIESAYQAQKARVLAQADKMDKLNQMAADVMVKRDQYQRLASQVEQMKAMALAGESPLEPMGNTNLPDEPVWPNKPLVMAGALIVGGLLGILLALLVELLARRVRSEDDLEFATGVPVLAVVGQTRSDNFISNGVKRLLDRDGSSKQQALAEA